MPSDHSQDGLDAFQFVFDSLRVSAKPELAAYASESFPSGRPLLEAAFDLTARIHHDFRFDPKATEVTTPVETFFEKRRGVCQDFSHLQIACMRSLGLPARYVSGYLRTVPPPAAPAWWALTPPTPGVLPGAPAMAGSTLTPPTTASPPMATSPWRGEGITATSAPSAEFCSVAQNTA